MELNCKDCIHRDVCKHRIVCCELWEDLSLDSKFQELHNCGFIISANCINYKKETKIIKGGVN